VRDPPHPFGENEELDRAIYLMAVGFGWSFHSICKLFKIKELEARARLAWQVREFRGEVAH
jgi:hypothetical protein